MALVLGALCALYQGLTWPRVGRLEKRAPEASAFMDRYERQSGQQARYTFVAYARISDQLKRAVVVSEDIGFFSHEGFEWREMEAAIDATLDKGKPLRGASTISQQLAKNLWLAPSRNPWRKVKEAALTWQLERTLSKQRILELYLNVAEFGKGIYGAEAAARYYYGKSAADLSASEAAALAASLPRPSSWHPGVSDRRYQRRIRMVLARMEKTSWLKKFI